MGSKSTLLVHVTTTNFPKLANQSTDYWEQFRQGHQEAFTHLYYRYVDALYHYGERLTPDRALIEDCLQDLFAELWNRHRQLPKVDSVKFYLFKALKRKIVKKRHQAQRFLSHPADEYDFEITLAPDFELADHQMTPPEKDRLLRAINQLSPRQKEAITLYFYDGFSYEEIGKIMLMGTRSVYNLVYRALAALRQTLGTTVSQSVWLVLIALVFG